MEPVGYYIDADIDANLVALAAINGVSSITRVGNAFVTQGGETAYEIRDAFVSDQFRLSRSEASRLHASLIASGARGSSTCLFKEWPSAFLFSDQIIDCSACTRSLNCQATRYGKYWAEFTAFGVPTILGVRWQAGHHFGSFLTHAWGPETTESSDAWQQLCEHFVGKGFRDS